jgi:UDP-N-acetylglucosamine transferase subunit ALG13
LIFVTVGAQMPFDRLVTGVDEWAGSRGIKEVFAQIGPSDLRPRHIEWTNFLQVPEFKKRMDQASVIVAHAGMGSIITALEMGKPILVMPRRSSFRETRNDHQVATAKRFLELGRVGVAFDEKELLEMLDKLDSLQGNSRISSRASDQLIAAVRDFIEHA